MTIRWKIYKYYVPIVICRRMDTVTLLIKKFTEITKFPLQFCYLYM